MNGCIVLIDQDHHLLAVMCVEYGREAYQRFGEICGRRCSVQHSPIECVVEWVELTAVERFSMLLEQVHEAAAQVLMSGLPVRRPDILECDRNDRVPVRMLPYAPVLARQREPAKQLARVARGPVEEVPQHRHI